MSASRKALAGACLTLLTWFVVAACGVSPAASLGLPVLPIEAPTALVQVPSVPVTAPTVPVKAPIVPVVPVKTPTVPVKTQTAPGKTPTAPGKTPTAPTKTPSVPVNTTTGKAPSVKVDTPTVSGKAPPVSAPVPPVPASGKVEVYGGGATTTTTSRPTVSQSAGTESAAAPQGSTTTGAPSAAPSAQTSPADGVSAYGTGPTPESLNYAPGAGRSGGERARAASDGSLVSTVARLQGCLSELPESPRRVLMLRSGVGSPQALGPRAAAARLHFRVAHLVRVERQALGELRTAARTGACGQMSELVASVVAFLGQSPAGGSPVATGDVEAARYTFSPPSRHAIGPASSSSGSLLGSLSPVASDAIVVLLLVVAGLIAAGLVIAYGSGNSPRLRRWRRRLADGVPWSR